MATENKRLNVNPILWSTADKTFVPASGEIWYYYETAGSILSVVGDGSSTVQELRDGAYINQVDNLGLSSGRTAFQELTSGTLSTSGWYTIAEAPAGTANGAMATINVISNGGRCGGCQLAIRPTNTARDLTNTSISLLGGANSAAKSYVTDIVGFRLATSDTEGDGGFKLQMNVNGSTTFNIQMASNLGRSTLSGLKLVTPYLDNTPTLPDGVTVATFIEAGAEFKTDSALTILTPRIAWRKSSDDIIRLIFQWDEIPKQGTNLALSFTTFILRDLSGVAVSFNGTETLGVITKTGREVVVQATRSLAWSTLTGGGMIDTLGLVATIS